MIGSHDAFVYWREFRNGSWTIWRSQPDGKWRARVSQTFGTMLRSFATVTDDTGMLVFEADGTLWAIDGGVLPKYACVDLLATHIDGRDWLFGGDGDDEVPGNAGDDDIEDKLGANDTNGGPGTDLCEVTGSAASCELP